jgi:hypothetical protein
MAVETMRLNEPLSGIVSLFLQPQAALSKVEDHREVGCFAAVFVG